MNIGASMVAKRVRQEENGQMSWRGIVIGAPIAALLWVAIVWLLAVVAG